MQDLPSPAAANTPNIQLSLFGGGPDPSMTRDEATVVLVAWAVGSLALGGWRLLRTDASR